MAKKDSAGSVVFLGLLGTGIGVLAVDYAFSDPGLSMVDKLIALVSGKKSEAGPSLSPALPGGKQAPAQPPDWLRQGLPGWALPEAPAPKAPLYPAAGFDQGLVREAQQRLDALNLPQLKTRLDALGAPSIPSWVPLPLKVDGFLGDKTKAVLKALQGAMGVSATGLPDDATMGLLRNPGVLDALKRAIGETGKPTLPTPGPRKQTTVQSSSAPAISVPLSQQAPPPVTYTPFPMPQLSAQAQASTPGSGPGTRPFPSMPQPMPQPQQLPAGQGFGVPGLGSVQPAPWLLELGQELGLVRTGASAAPAPSPGVIALPAPLPAALAQETAQLGPSAQAVLQRALSSETDQATLLDLAGKLAASNMPKTAQALAAKVSWSATRVGFGGGRAPWQSPWLPGEPQAIGWW